MVDCAFVDDGKNEPSLFEHPFQLAVGSSILPLYVGSTMVTSLVFIVLPSMCMLANFITAPRDKILSKLRTTLQYRVFSTALAIGSSYFLAIIYKSMVFVILHGSGDATSTVIVIVAVTISTVPVVALAYAVGGPVHGQNVVMTRVGGKPEYEANKSSASAEIILESTRAFFDGSRQPHRGVSRCFFFEETLVSILLGILDGIRPSSGACGGVATAMLVVCVLHVGYLVLVRPYRSKLEQALVCLGALLLLLLSAIATIITFSEHNPTLLSVLGVVALAESGVFFFQAAALAFWAYTVRQRRKVLQSHRKVDGELDDGDTASPLLITPQEDNQGQPQPQEEMKLFNPLA